MQVGVVIFCYKRLDKFTTLLDSLSKNNLKIINKFFVYQDGLLPASSDIEIYDHKKIKLIWENFVQKNNILSFSFVQSSENLGLRTSILNGLDSAFSEVDSLIILEDDLYLHSQFLDQMTRLLKCYERDQSIGHINGWSNFQVLPFSSNNQIVRTSMMYCWGWATWKDRWYGFRASNVWEIRKFNLVEKFKYDYFFMARLIHQLTINWSGKKKTWAVFWYLYLRLNKLKCIGYNYSLSTNEGNDGSGENCKKVNSLIFSFLTDGQLTLKNLFRLREHEFFNVIFYFNLIIWLFIRNLYLLLVKIIKK